ncbi:glycoside hydrolase family 6 protein [Streptomyces spirodelae]|uniref:Glucanase n=1 Tax=Streptomyces spirodelae TaxID=2812904 RepID=A0ABS3WP06_9ACTN|nr:glycoside hydrolase family 6 protein [Streptomyces spirodelae]MBO8184846.1 glycoside hydrolase family 6 protein [Streptomyces spirodelae]
MYGSANDGARAARAARTARGVRSARTACARTRALAGSALAGVLLLAGCSSSSGGPDDGDTQPGPTVRQRPKSVTPYWVDPKSNAARQARTYADDGKSAQAAQLKKIAAQPVAEWIDAKDPRGHTARVTEAAADAGREALLVLYNVPHRDCGQYSKGGAQDAAAYRDWLDGVAKGIGERSATVIVEPDALAHTVSGDCASPRLRKERLQLLDAAVTKLKELPRTKVYLDAGNPDWVRDPGALVEPLNRSGIAEADGFALNVSNFQTTASNIAYGKRLSSMVGGKHFVVDTSRNGNGPLESDAEESWCNPPGRALGEAPTTRTGHEVVDAFLWVKRPGESDGECRGGPKAGAWWPSYALELTRNTET